MGNRQSKSEIAHDILSYLNANPEARDTLGGIIEWWLLEEQIKYRSEKVKAAIAELVQKGLLIESLGKDSQVHYRINSERAEEIRSLLDRDKKRRKKRKRSGDPSETGDDDGNS